MKNKVLTIPSMEVFDNKWGMLFSFLERRGFPDWTIKGELNLSWANAESLYNLIEVDGPLVIRGSNTPESLGKLKKVNGHLDLELSDIQDLGELTYVGGYLDLKGTNVTTLKNIEYVDGFLNIQNSRVESLGNLKYVKYNFYINRSPLSNIMTDEEIRSMVEIKGDIVRYYS